MRETRPSFGSFSLLLVLVMGATTTSAAQQAEWMQPYASDASTIALFHFDGPSTGGSPDCGPSVAEAYCSESATLATPLTAHERTVASGRPLISMPGEDTQWDNALSFRGIGPSLHLSGGDWVPDSIEQGLVIAQAGGELDFVDEVGGDRIYEDGTIEFRMLIRDARLVSVPLQLGLAYQVKLTANRALTVAFKHANWEQVTPGAPLDRDRWYHVAIRRFVDESTTADTGSIKIEIFVDGALYASETFGEGAPIGLPGPTNEPLHIGFDRWGTSNFDGMIDELRISSKLRGLVPSWSLGDWRRPFDPEIDGTEAVFSLSEGSGDSIAGIHSDGSAKYSASLGGGATWLDVVSDRPSPEFGPSLRFDGSIGQGIEVLNPSGDLAIVSRDSGGSVVDRKDATIEFWLKADAIGNQMIPLQLGHEFQVKVTPEGQIDALFKAGDPGTWYSVVHATSSVEAPEVTSEAFVADPLVPLVADRWYHVRVVRDVDADGNVGWLRLTTFIDGVRTISRTWDGPPLSASETAPLVIGKSWWDTDQLEGAIDEIRISEGARGSTTVAVAPLDDAVLLQNPHMGWRFDMSPKRWHFLGGFDFDQQTQMGGFVDYFDMYSLLVSWDDLQPNGANTTLTTDCFESLFDQFDGRGPEKTIMLRLVLSQDPTPVWGKSPASPPLDCRPEGPPGAPAWVFAEVGKRTIVETPPLTNMEHPHYEEPAYADRARAFLGELLRWYETELDDERAGKAGAIEVSRISFFNVHPYGRAGEWDQGTSPYPWSIAGDGIPGCDATVPQLDCATKTDSLDVIIDAYRQVFDSSGLSLAINFAGWADCVPGGPAECVNAADYAIYVQSAALDNAFAEGWGVRYDALKDGPPAPIFQELIQDDDDTNVDGLVFDFDEVPFVSGELGLSKPGNDPAYFDAVVDTALGARMNHVGAQELLLGGSGFPLWKVANSLPGDPSVAAQHDRGLRNMGYRLVLDEITYPKILSASAPPAPRFEITTRWRNLGVGRLYRPYALRFYLVDDLDQIVWAQTDTRFDVTQIVNGYDYDPAESIGCCDSDGESFEFTARSTLALRTADVGETPLSSGTYRLAVALVDAVQTPSVELAIAPTPIPGQRIYPVGTVEVQGAPGS